MINENPQVDAPMWKMLFTPYAKSVYLVRAQVAKALAAWGCCGEAADDVVLICSELAANAVQHARTPGRLFMVRLTLRGRECLVEVSDATRVPPRRVAPGPEDEQGRGLQLVAALAECTGHHDRDPLGKTVWARVLLPD
ncbi:ATP-binding protein [Streptomyces synnematoformans]|uniref:ATP-binding protein n=1 Tax=Streptomyces synnematoformans TaxID=415721 RepID=A0ABP5KHR2_9ACTN